MSEGNGAGDQIRNRRWVLDKRPTGEVGDDQLRFETVEMPRPGEGEALVRNIYLSIDPTHRIWMSDVDQYMEPVELGEVMRGVTLGIVEQSESSDLAPGDLVMGRGGWQDHYVDHARSLRRIVPSPDLPLSAYLGPLGNIGATAYFGLFEIGRPRPTDTVVVSAAAGAVGSLVGQMAKMLGCRVVGIVGSDAKAEWIVELGFDAAVNYRKGDLLEQLRAACPSGIDLYFDNVGGDILDAALTLINLNARIVVCGLISTYSKLEQGGGPRMFRNVLMKRARIEGFIVSDYLRRYPEAFTAIGRWLDTGTLQYRMDIRDGLENAPEALKLLFTGGNDGKLLVQISPEP